MLLVFGGCNDPNIKRLTTIAASQDKLVSSLVLTDKYTPAVLLDLDSMHLIVDQKPMDCQSIFIRDDVFDSCDRNTSATIYRLLKEYAFITKIKVFNRHYQGMHKVYNLEKAKEAGLAIPKTLLTNDLLSLQSVSHRPFAIKPIQGGAHTELLGELDPERLRKNQAPYFAQEVLVGPEVRIFVVGDRLFAFRISSPALDYRTDRNAKVEYIETPRHLVQPLLDLCRQLKLDFAAADFKTCPESSELRFLEINSGPMFARFDHACNGELCKAMLAWLTTPVV